MTSQVPLQDDQTFVAQLQDCAAQLVEKLQANNYDAASELIHNLVEARNNHIFKSVGQLTRGLHNAIVNFHLDADINATPPDNSEIRDASDRLNYVIQLTQAAANKTMDKVEAVAPIAMNLGQESANLKEEWQRLRRREISKEEFKGLYTRIDDFLEQMGSGTEQLNQSLQDIILEQGYQDLTGQVLKKVIGLISDVENELVNLMRIAGQVEEVTGMAADPKKAKEAKPVNKIEAEGPPIHADKRNDVVSGQDDVDDLLSSLGF
ncbi:MAG: chemotaxis protein CheZ [Lentisphaeria bacterium]|jgi:chemotaxis protein CheZ